MTRNNDLNLPGGKGLIVIDVIFSLASMCNVNLERLPQEENLELI